MAITMIDNRWICHCGQEARNDGSDYDRVCCQWPLCEKEGSS